MQTAGIQIEPELDLSIALRTLHELALAEGDLGREYWDQVGNLLRSVPKLRERIRLLEAELAALSLSSGMSRTSGVQEEEPCSIRSIDSGTEANDIT
jgi:hypothetical protein